VTLGCIPMCEFCKRIHTFVPPGKEALGCDAFPDGIPDQIYAAAFDHREQFKNGVDDHGLVFEARSPEALQQYLAMLKREHRDF